MWNAPRLTIELGKHSQNLCKYVPSCESSPTGQFCHYPSHQRSQQQLFLQWNSSFGNCAAKQSRQLSPLAPRLLDRSFLSRSQNPYLWFEIYQQSVWQTLWAGVSVLQADGGSMQNSIKETKEKVYSKFEIGEKKRYFQKPRWQLRFPNNL